MGKIIKVFETICLLSSAALSALTLVNPTLVVPSAALSLGSLVLNNNFIHRHSLNKRLNIYIQKAIDKTIDALESEENNEEAYDFLIHDLFETEIEINDAKDLINKTELLRQKYSDSSIVQEIVLLFNHFFVEEILQDDDLSRMCILNCGLDSVYELKKIYGIVQKTGETVNELDDKLTNVSTVVDKINHFLNTLLNSVIFALISTAIFLLEFIFTKSIVMPESENNAASLFWIVPLCYFIVEFLVHISKLKLKTLGEHFNFKKKYLYNIPRMTVHILSVITVFSICWNFLGSINSPHFWTLILFLVVGDVFGQLLSICLKKIS